jgi:predicted esterase
MVTRLLYKYQSQDKPIPFKFAVLIGGVPPKEINDNAVDIDSLHIYGRSDPVYEKSKILEKIYNNQRSVALEHDEGHNIPSINTNIYSDIKEWLYYKSLK